MPLGRSGSSPARRGPRRWPDHSKCGQRVPLHQHLLARGGADPVVVAGVASGARQYDQDDPHHCWSGWWAAPAVVAPARTTTPCHRRCPGLGTGGHTGGSAVAPQGVPPRLTYRVVSPGAADGWCGRSWTRLLQRVCPRRFSRTRPARTCRARVERPVMERQTAVWRPTARGRTVGRDL